MGSFSNKTPTASVEDLSDGHKSSDASKTASLTSSGLSQLPSHPRAAHLHGAISEKDCATAAQVEEVESGSRAPSTASAGDHQDTVASKDGLSWVNATCTGIAETLSLGILSLPTAVSKLGLVPGILLLIILGIVTTGTGFNYYLFKLKYTSVRSISQALTKVFGSWGGYIGDLILMVYLVLLMAGHIILFGEFVKVFVGPDNAPCRVAIMAIAYFINCLFTFYRKFNSLRFVCVACCLSILIATFTCLGFLAANKTENLSQKDNHSAFAFTPLGLSFGSPNSEGEHEVTTFFAACAAFSNILLSYSGSICYFNIIDEMEKPKDFWKCLLVINGATITMYTIAGVGMYALAGQTVMAPALGAAGHEGSQISYCFALPTILLAAVILANILSKRTEDIIYELRGQDAEERHRSQRNAFSAANVLWYIIVVVWWTLAFIVGNSLPYFGTLLSIIGSVSGNWICLGWPACFLLHIFWPETDRGDGTLRKWTRREVKEQGGWWRLYKETTTWRKILVPLMFFLILFNIAASAVGTYGAVMEFAQEGKGRKPFSCQFDWGDITATNATTSNATMT